MQHTNQRIWLFLFFLCLCWRAKNAVVRKTLNYTVGSVYCFGITNIPKVIFTSHRVGCYCTNAHVRSLFFNCAFRVVLDYSWLFPTITAEWIVAQQYVPTLRHSGYICEGTVIPCCAGCITHWVNGASIQGRANMGPPSSCCRAWRTLNIRVSLPVILTCCDSSFPSQQYIHTQDATPTYPTTACDTSVGSPQLCGMENTCCLDCTVVDTFLLTWCLPYLW
jgi:hypothetical protein